MNTNGTALGVRVFPNVRPLEDATVLQATVDRVLREQIVLILIVTVVVVYLCTGEQRNKFTN